MFLLLYLCVMCVCRISIKITYLLTYRGAAGYDSPNFEDSGASSHQCIGPSNLWDLSSNSLLGKGRFYEFVQFFRGLYPKSQPSFIQSPRQRGYRSPNKHLQKFSIRPNPLLSPISRPQLFLTVITPWQKAINWLFHVSAAAPSVAVPSLLLVLQSGIHCLTVCAIQLLDQNSFDGLWKPTCLPVVSVSLTVR